MTTATARRWARISPLVAVAAGSLAFSSAAATAAVPTSTAVNRAARLSTHADHTLVSAAKRLRSCRREHGARSSRCAGARRAVQLNGRRLARYERNLARLAREYASAHASSGWWAQRAPVLSVDGDRLSWTQIGSVRTYVLERSVPGEAVQYSLVHGTSTTPPPVPGLAVSYALRTDVSGSSWSRSRTISYPSPKQAPPAPQPGQPEAKPTPPETKSVPPETKPSPPERIDTQAAPALVVNGKQLSWNAASGVSAYVLASIVPGHATTYTEVSGTSTTPAAVPGTTVRYSVRTAVNGSVWAPEVAISYPAVVTPPPAKTTPTPTETPSSQAGTFEPGINGSYETTDVDNAAQLGAKIVRLAFPIGMPAAHFESLIAAYAAKGVRAELLAEFYGTLPTPAEAANLAGWAKEYGPGGSFWATRSDGQLAVRTIEFGNETSGGYQYGDEPGDASFTARAQTYAVRLKESAQAISAGGVKVGLLAVSEDWTGDWMNGMFSAVPNLGSYITGWISHPYGTGWKTKIEDIIEQAAAHGAPATLPIDVTEWGIATDNGRCLVNNYGLNPCMTYQEAAETMRRTVAEIRALLGSREGLFLIYQGRDQGITGTSTNRELYFGLVQHALQPKGAYTTAAEEVLAE
jgi:hypothetical protein